MLLCMLYAVTLLYRSLGFPYNTWIPVIALLIISTYKNATVIKEFSNIHVITLYRHKLRKNGRELYLFRPVR
jgi:hypothetical protein